MSSQLPFDEVTLLKDRNDKLSAQAAVHRQEIARLQREVDGLQDQEAKWRETVLCLNRLWEELNDAIGFMKYRYNTYFLSTMCIAIFRCDIS